jgi:hypothetical protein
VRAPISTTPTPPQNFFPGGGGRLENWFSHFNFFNASIMISKYKKLHVIASVLPVSSLKKRFYLLTVAEYFQQTG